VFTLQKYLNKKTVICYLLKIEMDIETAQCNNIENCGIKICLCLVIDLETEKNIARQFGTEQWKSRWAPPWLNLDAICVVDSTSSDLISTGSTHPNSISSFTIGNNEKYPFLWIHKEKFTNEGQLRTNCLNFASKHVFQELNWCPYHTFWLVLEPNMKCIENSDKFNKLNLDRSDIWSIAHKCNGVEYSIEGFLRASIGWHCLGLVRTYWSIKCPIDKKKYVALMLENVQIVDEKRSQASMIAVSNRTFEKLLLGLDQEPNNTRYMFYMAQAYRDRSQFKDAVHWYRKRIGRKGNENECWYSQYMIGWCLIKMASQSTIEKKSKETPKEELMSKGMIALRDAHRMKPIRIEPLFIQISELTKTQKYNEAMKLLQLALLFPKPTSGQEIFVEKEVYDWQLLQQLSVCSYYCGKEYFSMGLHSCEFILHHPDFPLIAKNISAKNRHYYMSEWKNLFDKGNSKDFSYKWIEISPQSQNGSHSNKGRTLSIPGLDISRWNQIGNKQHWNSNGLTNNYLVLILDIGSECYSSGHNAIIVRFVVVDDNNCVTHTSWPVILIRLCDNVKSQMCEWTAKDDKFKIGWIHDDNFIWNVEIEKGYIESLLLPINILKQRISVEATKVI